MPDAPRPQADCATAQPPNGSNKKNRFIQRFPMQERRTRFHLKIMHEVIIHIGTYKTGSTAIQQVFQQQNRTKLELYGWRAPMSGSDRHDVGAFHHPIARSLNDNVDTAERQRLFSGLHAEIDCPEAKRIFISSELFCNLGPKKLKILGNELARYPITILVYLRRQDEMLHSLYLTSIWYEQSRNATDPLHDPSLSKFVYVGDYAAILDNWKSAFPHARFIIRIYDRTMGRKGVVPDFLSIFGVPSEELASNVHARVNEHLPARFIEYLRLMNNREISAEAHRAIVLQLRKLAQEMGGELNQTRQWFISNEQRCSIIDRYAESNARLSHTWLTETGPTPFLDPMPDPTEPFHPVQLSAQEVAEISALLLTTHCRDAR